VIGETTARIGQVDVPPWTGHAQASQALFEASLPRSAATLTRSCAGAKVIEYKYGGLVNATRLARKQKSRE
jgi:hypothetical protein